MNFPHHIYLAGPFFNAQQIETMDKAKALCEEQGLNVFDPREHGPKIVDVKPADRTPAMLDAILKANVDGISSSYMVLACIDDRDTGTAWELGFAYASGVPTVTFSGRGFGANVMIARSVHGHLQSLLDLGAYLHRAGAHIFAQNEGELPQINSAADTVD